MAPCPGRMDGGLLVVRSRGIPPLREGFPLLVSQLAAVREGGGGRRPSRSWERNSWCLAR